eukprot:1159368-Pelagomonas_calceolata.AAC.2
MQRCSPSGAQFGLNLSGHSGAGPFLECVLLRCGICPSRKLYVPGKCAMFRSQWQVYQEGGETGFPSPLAKRLFGIML